jgi:hypothetical protein
LHAGRAHSVLVYATNLDCLELYVVEEVLRDATATMGGQHTTTTRRERAGASKQKGAPASVGDGPIPRQRLAFADAASTASAVNHIGVDSDTQTTGTGSGRHAGHDGQPAAFEGGNDGDDSEGSAYWAPDTMSLVDFIQVCIVLLHFGTRHTLSYILSRMVHPVVSLWCWTTTVMVATGTRTHRHSRRRWQFATRQKSGAHDAGAGMLSPSLPVSVCHVSRKIRVCTLGKHSQSHFSHSY